MLINIIDVNDNCPEFLQPMYRTGIPESAAQGTNVLDIIADDVDSGDGGLIVYSIRGANVPSRKIS